jgi:hypothetical protein
VLGARVLAREPGQSGLKRVTEQAAPRRAARRRSYKTPAKLGVERSLPTQSSLGRPTTDRVPAPSEELTAAGPRRAEERPGTGALRGATRAGATSTPAPSEAPKPRPFWARSSDRISNYLIYRGPGQSVRAVVLCGGSVSVRSSPEEVGHRTHLDRTTRRRHGLCGCSVHFRRGLGGVVPACRDGHSVYPTLVT